MKKALLLAPLAVVIMALPACKNDAVTLKMNFAPGSKYEQSAIVNTKVEQGGKSANSMVQMDYIYTVSAGQGTDRKIDVTYDRIHMDMSRPGSTMSYDSKKDSISMDNPISIVGKLVNKSFSMVVTETGEVQSVSGVQDMLSGMVDPSNPMTIAIRDQLAQQYNDSSIRNSMQQAFNVYPDKPVRPGDKRNKTLNISSGNMTGIACNTAYTLKDVTGGTAHISMTATLNGNTNTPAGSIAISGTETGSMNMDVATGLVSEMKMHQDVKMKIPGFGDIPMTNEITYTAKKK